jgi:hypothetical protein
MEIAVRAAAFFIWVNVFAAFAGEREVLGLPGTKWAWVHGETGLGLAGEPGCVSKPAHEAGRLESVRGRIPAALVFGEHERRLFVGRSAVQSRLKTSAPSTERLAAGASFHGLPRGFQTRTWYPYCVAFRRARAALVCGAERCPEPVKNQRSQYGVPRRWRVIPWAAERFSNTAWVSTN